MTIRFPLAGLLAALLLFGAGVVAQEAAQPDKADERGDSAKPAETNVGVTVSKEDTREADDSSDDAGDEADDTPPANASTDVFIPTEEVSVDKSISMPVDI